MSMPGTLVVITCNEANPMVDAARHFNLNTSTTRVIRTAGGRIEGAINSIYQIAQSVRIDMVIVVQHTSCPWSPGEVENNLRSDIQALKASPYVQKDVSIIGYVLDLASDQLREVNVPRTGPEAEARQQVLDQMKDFGPFWS
ncbi:hypothetical protein J3E72DRAFT_410852 [Bipolaris maydis]|uniref:uncharacterized protein n=1 Tax=Cochliobolus heterostrophus TaxID=5016 RepID=UPI0024D1BC4E|nr:hypothetical protein J3E73DRAFT_397091 [Bipolaris maydis]KAJ5060012.1 hypothetical protein J3E74DRAFT_452206 [Bipolaris maydis]KAJ6202189.1 hypothetical protein J3E72DRAFT_410852 [Bipolaris maydis]KAJ6273213.1 hypothetical protein PSV08DRAFT_385611 [Bipolaris maydis]KAJ6284422.1 hypothetical protein J3E71DRAFT_375409 [Bipolaris maydis]